VFVRNARRYMSLHAMDPMWPEESRQPWIHLLREVTEDTGGSGPAAGADITNLANMLMLWESQVSLAKSLQAILAIHRVGW
jgi:hypothetical protein